MPKVIEKSYEVDAEGNLSIWVRGIPFGGPAELDGKDFEGEYFDKTTDLGPLTRVLSYFDHAKLAESLPDGHPAKSVAVDFSKTLIGVADQELTDDEGVIWKIIVDKDHKYKNLLKRLADARMIKGSSTPFQRTVQINEKSGHIDRWHVIEMTACVTPCNPDAVQVDFYKSIGDELLMAEKTPVITEDKNEEKTASVTEQIDQIFEETTVGDNAGDAEKATNIPTTLTEILSRLDSFSIQISGYATMEKTLEKMQTDLEDLQIAIPKLGQYIAKSLTGKVEEIADKSLDERQAEKSAASRVTDQKTNDKSKTAAKSDLPDGAPR